MWRFRRLLHIKRLLRFLELAGALVVISYSYSYIPPIARSSGAFLRRGVVVLISPTFVFLLGNAIVLVLFAKSGQIPSTAEAPSDLSYVDGSVEISSNLAYSTPPHLREAEEDVFEDKKVCVEIGVCTQSRSEELERVKEEPKIRESKTEVSCDAGKSSPPPFSPPADSEVKGVADEEEDAERFRRTVEEFIEKQQWFQRQESLSHISYSAGLPEPVAV